MLHWAAALGCAGLAGSGTTRLGGRRRQPPRATLQLHGQPPSQPHTTPASPGRTAHPSRHKDDCPPPTTTITIARRRHWATAQPGEAATAKGRPLKCRLCRGTLILNAKALQQHLGSRKHEKRVDEAEAQGLDAGDDFCFAEDYRSDSVRAAACVLGRSGRAGCAAWTAALADRRSLVTALAPLKQAGRAWTVTHTPSPHPPCIRTHPPTHHPLHLATNPTTTQRPRPPAG